MVAMVNMETIYYGKIDWIDGNETSTLPQDEVILCEASKESIMSIEQEGQGKAYRDDI